MVIWILLDTSSFVQASSDGVGCVSVTVCPHIRLVPCPEGAMLTLDWALSKRGAVSEVATVAFD